MKLTFLGTAAATSFPLTFCRCENCENARKYKGKSIRKRSSALVDDKILIDFCPDFVTALNTYDKDITKIEILLQTHPHSDHFDGGHFVTRWSEYAAKNLPHLRIVASQKCLERMSEMIKANENIDIFSKTWQKDLNISLCPLEHGQTTEIDDYFITAIESLHSVSQGSVLFLIEREGKKILYATDTVELSDKALEALSGQNIDCVVLDHTYGNVENSDGHLNEKKFKEQLLRLKEVGAIRDTTAVYATHISHEGCAYHEEMERQAGDSYKVAYDGLEIEI